MRATTIGLVVNPVAGIGGRVGLKGSDDVVDEARARGGTSPSQERSGRFLARLRGDIAVLTVGGPMGADACVAAGREHDVAIEASDPTTSDDTKAAARELAARGVDVLVFVGGDGTARDIADAVDGDLPVLGVPSGVKMYSGVFAHTPEAAARVLAADIDTHAEDVVDADEDAIRGGSLAVELHGSLRVPSHPDVQCGKSPGGGDVEGLAEAFAADADPEARYILGPGTTMLAAKRALAGDGSLLGVDVVRDARVEVRDAAEDHILALLDDVPTWIVVSPIGEQGFVLGRGNAPISAAVVRAVGWDHVRVLATPEKLAALRELHIDTGDIALDAAAPRFVRAITGRGRQRLVPVANDP